MSTVKVRAGKARTIRVVTASDQRNAISVQDAMMDARAVQAVKCAVAKAEFCKKPVAKYDVTTKKAYIQYANGARKYVK